MKLPPLTVIEASAGTGKTFSLVTRLLCLIFDGTQPERIVALTFSRMAAGEIFNSFIERLSKAAGDEKKAMAESALIGRKLASADFAAKLREVIARQHLSLIGTLDSFMMRVVRMIPFELGLGGEISIVGDYRTPVERMRLVGEMMMRENDNVKSLFRQAFRLALGGAGTKGFLGSFSDFIEKWHARYRDMSEGGALPSAWGDESEIWGDGRCADFAVTLAEIRAHADRLAEHAGKNGADTFIEAVRKFSGSIPNIPKCMREDPVAQSVVGKMAAWKIGCALKETQGIFLLMYAYESAYASNVRSRGLVTFDDLPRLLNSLPQGVRLPIEYRMDAQFDHWALDEFQDTSRAQWKAIRNLIDEASHPDSDKSVFIVGDRKQSIYEWRGGDVEILARQVARAKSAPNRLEALNESYRYVDVVAKAINDVFGEDVVRGAIDMDGAGEGAKWTCREHVSHDKDKPGYVQVVQAVKKGRTASTGDFFEPIENALNAVRPWDRGISTAILVRKNDFGEAILAYLKSKGIAKVVFEGDSAVSDCPVLSAMAQLVKLAEHSNDAFSYAQIKNSPIGSALCPDGVPEPEVLSARLLDDFTRSGMVRTFREVREALKSVPDSWNDFTESRFEDFIKCAAEFEEMRDATMRLSDFIEFVSNRKRRDFAESGMVRIMSMHQSKGLGFDWVIIPFYEPEKMSGSHLHAELLEHSDPRWIMSHPGISVALSDPVLAKAERTRQQVQVYNSLCLDYVAMTRAKRALTLILHPENAKAPPTPEKFSDLVRYVGLKTSGDPAWYREFGPVDGGNETKLSRSVVVRARRQAVHKQRPSEMFYAGLRGDALFSGNFGAAARRGVEVHAYYQNIEWADDATLKSLPAAFRAAFAKPSDDATLWRERAYELYDDGCWQSGQFDRVVFADGVDGRTATIYDFKTNVKRRGENSNEFAQRMRGLYSSQMLAYRHALARLTDIPEERINCYLLLEDTSEAMQVE